MFSRVFLRGSMPSAGERQEKREMYRNTEELLQSPMEHSVLYYRNGWLGGKTIRKSLGYWVLYKMAPPSVKAILRKEEIGNAEYQAASEKLYLSGRLGLGAWGRCVKEWIRFKSEKKAPVIPSVQRNVSVSGQEELLGQMRDKYEAMGGDKNRVWIFDAGNRFLGNPKWLFLYVNKYRQDILACWMSDMEEAVNRVRNLGFYAFLYGTREAEAVKDMAGVYVVENVKEHIPAGLEHAKMLNLFHGVGCKRIERNLRDAFFSNKLAVKYIKNNEYYMNNQLLVVTSPFIEKDFHMQIGVARDKLIRAGYPRCIYQKYFEPIHTFRRNLFMEKGLPETTPLAVYAPTYRNGGTHYFFSKAIPSMERLNEVLREKGILLILKFHPFMEADPQYMAAWEREEKYSNLIFWRNEDDFYEIMHEIDLAIVDYSSIFTDLAAAGVEHFIRYVFDYEEEKDRLDLMYDYFEVTAGRVCRNFEELLAGIGQYGREADSGKTERIRQLYWEYSGRDSMEKIIQCTLDYKIEEKALPVLYSYDIFDTVFTRKTLSPEGIFFYVREKMEQEPGMAFPRTLVKRYPEIRKSCEANARFRRVRKMENEWDRREIYFEEIFDNMRQVYGLNETQCTRLKEWELEAELDNVLPIEERIVEIKNHLVKGEDVVFISDMYLPKEQIRKMLCKADASLEKVPLFVSSELGVQKTTGKLYLEVYNSFDFYKYKEWIHTGDNVFADQTQPRKLGIRTRNVSAYKFNAYEKALVEALDSYDGYLIAGNLARFRYAHTNKKEIFARNYVSFYFIPYISWVLRDAVKRGYRHLYFVARDGHHLKKIADILIGGYPIQTSYLYASRKTWRIPSYVKEVDEEFFSAYGDFVEIGTVKGFLKAAQLSPEQFAEMFPEQAQYLEQEYLTTAEKCSLTEELRISAQYRTYLLGLAAERRAAGERYLRQEMNFEEKFAVVEYWGRGYTQDCFVRIVENMLQRKQDVPFYYVRSIDGTEGSSVKYNYSANTTPLLFAESLFSNISYKSVADYEEGADGTVKPVLENRAYDKELFEAMERYLAEMCSVMDHIGLTEREQTERALFEFSLNYYAGHPEDEILADCLGPLTDAVAVNGELSQYAREINVNDMERISRGENAVYGSRDPALSYSRSTAEIQNRLDEIYQGKENLFCAEKKLNASQVSTGRKMEEKLKAYDRAAVEMQKLYEKNAAMWEVNPHRLLILTSDYEGEEFYSLRKALAGNRKMDVFVLRITKNTCSDTEMQEIATARFILTSSNMELLSMLRLRKETKAIQIMNIAFPYIKIGKSRQYKIEKEGEYTARKLRSRYACVPIASYNLTKTITEAYGLEKEACCMATGSCVTDVYFCPEYRKKAADKLKKLLPKTAKKKKIIAYMPLHRYRNAGCSYLQLLDLKRLTDLLGTEYIILFMPEGRSRKDIPEEYFRLDRVFFLEGKMTIREQLTAADIIVGDYRHTFFESALLSKPIYCTAADYGKVERESQVYYPFTEVRPGPIVGDADQLAAMIREADSYDCEYREKFRERYLGNCRGDAAEQLIRYLEAEMENGTGKEGTGCAI